MTTFGCVDRVTNTLPKRVRTLEGRWRAVDRMKWTPSVYTTDAFRHDFCKFALVLDREGDGTLAYGPSGASATVRVLSRRGRMLVSFRRTSDGGHLPSSGVMRAKLSPNKLDLRLTYEVEGAQIVEYFHRRKVHEDAADDAHPPAVQSAS